MLVVASGVVLAACAGNGKGLDAAGRPLLPGGAGAGALVATFESIQANVFTPICTVCHAGGAAPQGLRLDSVNSYALLVGVPSNEVPSLLRVRPGDPDHSYVIQKLEGHAAVGAQMPFGGPPLPAATIAVIRQWISDGAQRSAPTAAAPALVVTAVTPARGDAVFASPARVVVEFSQELDQTRLDATSVRLERFGDGAVHDAVPVRLAVPVGNPRALLVEVLTPLADGQYRLVIAPPPSTGVSAIDGARVGGDAAAPVPFVVTQFDVVVNP